MVGGGLHRPLDRLLPGRGRPHPAHRRHRARRGGLRGLGPQRRVVLGAVRRARGTARPGGWARRRGRHAPGHGRHRRRGGPGGRRTRPSTAASPRGARWCWPGPASSSSAPADEVAGARAAGIGPEDLRLLSAAEASLDGPGHQRAGRDLHPPLRRGRPGAAGAGSGRGGGAPRRDHLRADRGAGRAARAPWTPMRGTVRAPRVVRATEGYTRTLRGEERTLVPVYSLMIATEPLPDGVLGPRPGWPGGRPSPTTAIWSSTASAPRTAGWPSAGGGRPTTSGRRSDRSTTATPACTRRCATTLVDLFPALAEVGDHPSVGRAARDRPRLVHLGRARPGHRRGVGRRLRGRRGVDHQPGRPDPRAT